MHASGPNCFHNDYDWLNKRLRLAEYASSWPQPSEVANERFLIALFGTPVDLVRNRSTSGKLLRAAVGFAGCSMLAYDRALPALRSWLDSWPGIGRVAVGIHRQSFDLQLTQYDRRGRRATFYATGMEHSLTSATSGLRRRGLRAP